MKKGIFLVVLAGFLAGIVSGLFGAGRRNDFSSFYDTYFKRRRSFFKSYNYYVHIFYGFNK